MPAPQAVLARSQRPVPAAFRWSSAGPCPSIHDPAALGDVRIETVRLLMREFAEDDHASIQAWAADPEVVRYEAWGPNTDEQTRDFLRGSAAARRSDARAVFDLGFALKDSGLLIGSGRIRIVGQDCVEGDIGYALRRDAWGRGYATEAARALVAFAAACLRLRRLSATCQVENVRSVRVLEKVGMSCRSRFRHDARRPGATRESYVYELCMEDLTRLHGSTRCAPPSSRAS